MGKTETEKTKEYRKKTSLELIEKYKDLIQKTFEVADKDLLQEQIDNEDENQKEQRLLEALKKRRVAFDEVDIMLEKIEKLETSITNIDGKEGEDLETKNVVKKFTKQ